MIEKRKACKRVQVYWSGEKRRQTQCCQKKRKGSDSHRSAFIAQDGGFTTVGVAVALLLVLALLFTAAQVRWVQSQSADIQFVADAGALAGGNVVGEYIVMARVADAVVLSLSLLGMATYGIAIVVSCIPSLQAVGAELMKFGQEVFKARDKCADTAAAALNRVQAALPFLIALRAAETINANSGISASYASYRGFAIPLPLEGEDVRFPDDEAAEESGEALGEKNSETAKHTDEAQEAYEKMESSKRRAFLADCGNNPDYCMFERAKKLAQLNGSSNPLFSSEETWLFDYAYSRAEAYYAKRLIQESPESAGLEEQVRSLCRERFYTYALRELEAGWCRTAADGTLDAHFPVFPKNTDEVRQSELYTEQVYPLSSDGVLHGSVGCPAYQASGSQGRGSVEELEAGIHRSCETCRFAASTIGKVASASTSIDNGFEYHYRIVAEEAKNYQIAEDEYHKSTAKAKDSAEESFDLFEEAMKTLKTPRLNPKPPGHNGVLAFVIDTETHAIPAGFSNPAVSGTAELQPRIALSAAALAEEKADDGANILASFLDKALAENVSSSLALEPLEAFRGILSLWGSTLLVYSRGGDALSEGLSAYLDALPFVKATPLSRWAKTALSDTVTALGLEGADLDTPRPLVINTIHVLRTSDLPPTYALLQAKEAYSSIGGSGSGTFGEALIDGLVSALSTRTGDLLESEFVLYEIRFGDNPGLPRLPITIRLPEAVVERGRSVIDNLAQAFRVSLGGGQRLVWE